MSPKDLFSPIRPHLYICRHIHTHMCVKEFVRRIDLIITVGCRQIHISQANPTDMRNTDLKYADYFLPSSISNTMVFVNMEMLGGQKLNEVEVTHLVKCLLHNMRTGIRISSTHRKSQAWWDTHVILMLGRQRQEDPEDLPASQLRQLVSLRLS